MSSQSKKMLISQDNRTKGGNMADCSNSGTKKVCWICEDKEHCTYKICYEQEITEQIKREEEAQIDMFETDHAS